MEIHIEKPFQCTTCLARFTNEDHLVVHGRRHEMSLNLGLGSSGKLEDGFVDQTPTPTHLCRSLEDVGLFQDLQNINPFDVQFSKATPSHIHNDAGFEFNFSFPRAETETEEEVGSRGRDNETLNTPQIPGYPPTTPLPDIRTKKVLTPSQETQEALGSSLITLHPERTKMAQQVEKEASDSAQAQAPTPNTIPRFTFKTPSQELTSVSGTEELRETSDGPHRKTEMLERNRAAASRSRERRKQWVSSLESKCVALQTALTQAQSELSRVRTENGLLKEELARQAHSTHSTPLFHPAILRSATTTPTTPTPTSLLPPLLHIPSQPTRRAKRGRPRKGEELQVCRLPQTPSSPLLQPIPKIQILPISALRPPSFAPPSATPTLLLPNHLYILNPPPPPS